MRYDVGRFRRPMRRSTDGQLMSLISLGDGSTLSLDFTAMSSLDSRFTFTRASTATYINSSGLVTTMAAASTNDPTKARFDYDPTTLAPRGLLIEASTTNLLNWSESFATTGGTNNNWADTNITRNSTNNTDPANGTTALRVTAASANGTIISTAAIGTSAQRTFSIWLRRVSGTGDIQYTLDNGSTYTTQAITSSWVRYTFASTTAAQRVGIRIVTSGDSIELWGAQLETGSGSSSYIPTGSSSVQRAAELCQMSGTNFSSWYGSPTAFSMLFEGIAQISANYGRVLCLSSGANTTSGIPNFNLGLSAATSNRPFINAHVVANNNVDTFAPAGAAVTNGVPFKIGLRHQTSSHYITRGASLSAANSYAGFAAGLANLYFGNTDGSTHRSIHYTRVKFWPLALSNAQLDLLAT